jgi:retron-type reverse transcriptase
VPALEDKIVQKAASEILNAIYEADFIGFSYGFRPGRSQHNVLDALYVGFMKRRVNWVLDADIRDFFGSLNREWLIKFIEHRIGDKRVVRLIQKWLLFRCRNNNHYSDSRIIPTSVIHSASTAILMESYSE